MVEEVLKSVNGLLQRGMDWGDIERLIEVEKGRGNVVAMVILRCLFREGKVVLGLREDDGNESGGDESGGDDNGDETEEEEEEVRGEGRKGKIVEIEVDLGLSAWANAQEYFNKKKIAAEKVLSFSRHPLSLTSHIKREG